MTKIILLAIRTDTVGFAVSVIINLSSPPTAVLRVIALRKPIPAVRLSSKTGQARCLESPISQTGLNCLFLTIFDKNTGF